MLLFAPHIAKEKNFAVINFIFRVHTPSDSLPSINKKPKRMWGADMAINVYGSSKFYSVHRINKINYMMLN